MPESFTYSTVEQFLEHIGTLKAGGMSGLDATREPAYYQRLLLAATGTMNGEFSRAGYTVPLLSASIADADTKAQLLADLSFHCSTLAAWRMSAGLMQAPEGVRQAKEGTTAWLKDLVDGKAELLGLARDAKAARSVGRFGVVLGNDNLGQLGREIRAFGRLGH